MAKTLIFEEQAITFALESSFGVYVSVINPPVFMFEKGETYTILWDGVEYVCSGDDITLNGMYLQGVGNRALSGGENTGEPFGIASAQTDGVPYYNAMMSADTAESHTVAIWHGAEDAAIVLKDRDGNPVQHKGVQAVNMLMQDGTEQIFTPGEAQQKTVAADFSGGDMKVAPDSGKLLTRVTVQKPETLLPENIVKNVTIAGIPGAAEIPDITETTIDPDFSGGNMSVVPADGSVFSKVTVQQPANLIPENIAEGVNIAGIIGALAGGGASGVVIASGYGGDVSAGSTGVRRITHNLGVVPDVFFICTNITSGNNYLYMAIGFSSAFASKLSMLYPYSVMFIGKTSLVTSNAITTAGSGIDTLTATRDAVISNATATTVDIGTSTYKFGDKIASWFAIGGLT